jgi:hypothetical protein
VVAAAGMEKGGSSGSASGSTTPHEWQQHRQRQHPSSLHDVLLTSI